MRLTEPRTRTKTIRLDVRLAIRPAVIAFVVLHPEGPEGPEGRMVARGALRLEGEMVVVYSTRRVKTEDHIRVHTQAEACAGCPTLRLAMPMCLRTLPVVRV